MSGKPPYPVSIELHREVANWLVGLAVGALAFAFGRADYLRAAPWTAQGIALITAVALCGAVFAGVQLYTHLTALARCYESEADAQGHTMASNTSAAGAEVRGTAGAPSGQPPDDAFKTKKERSKRAVNSSWTFLTQLFPLGALGIAVLAALSALGIGAPASPGGPFVVIAPADSAGTRPTLLYERATNTLWTVDLTTPSAPTLRRVTRPSSGVAPGSSAGTVPGAFGDQAGTGPPAAGASEGAALPLQSADRDSTRRP